MEQVNQGDPLEPERASEPEISEQDIPQDSLRIEPERVSRELYGVDRDCGPVYSHRDIANYDAINSHGSAAYGNHNIVTCNYHSYDQLREPTPHVIAVRDLSGRLAGYTPSPSHGRLRDQLRTRRVVSLSGPGESGRFTTACAVLTDLYPADGLREILLPAGDPGTLAQDWSWSPQPGHGHVMRLPGTDHGQLIRVLEDRVSRADARLVLIRDVGIRDSHRRDGTVYHTVSSSAERLRAQVRHLLRVAVPGGGPRMTASEIDGYVESILAMTSLGQVLDEADQPGDVEAVAVLVARHRPRDERTMDEALAEAPPRRRSRARGILLSEEGTTSSAAPPPGIYERSFRISYVVFHGSPVRHVFTTAGWLLAQVEADLSGPHLERLALGHPVAELLGADLATDWRDGGRDRGGDGGGTSRVAWLRDPGMRGAVLDVAWHEFDNTRPAILGWLNRLAESREAAVELVAAETAGYLAHFDFEEVCQRLIDQWAGSARPAIRQVAAWAIRIAHLGGQNVARVQRKVRAWARSDLARRRDTAARVYASGFSQPCVDWTLADLRHIASDPMQRRNRVVAEAVHQLYQPDRAGQIVAELAAWIAVDGPNADRATHAIRSLSILAGTPRGGTTSGTPDLLCRLVNEQVDVGHLAALWTSALREPAEGARSWQLLETWLRHADSPSVPREPVRRFLSLLAGSDLARARLRFYLTRFWHGNPQGPPTWAMTAIEGGVT